MNLKNAVALVTGGSAGIGYSIAKTLAESGAKVAITGRDKARLEAAAKDLGALGIQADVSKEADVERTYSEVLAKFGDLDILVNNAGVGVFKPLVELELARFKAVFDTNVTGAMLMGREAAKIFIKRNRGNIINIASTAALRGAPNGTAYYGSKFALRGMTECWRAELRKYNIRVMLVNPSEVLTGFAATAGFPQKATEGKLRGDEIAHAVKAMLEMDDRGLHRRSGGLRHQPGRLTLTASRRALIFQAPPQVPARDAAVRMPGRGDRLHFLRFGQLRQTVGFLHGRADAQIAHRQDIGTLQREHQEHLDRPDAHAFHAGQGFDDGGVFHLRQALELNVAVARQLREFTNIDGLLLG